MSPVIKNRGEKFTVSGKFLLMILTILCILLMAVSFGTDVLNRPLNTAVGYVIVPFQSGIGKLGGYLSRRSEELVAIRSLLDENAQLKEQIATIDAPDRFDILLRLNDGREIYWGSSENNHDKAVALSTVIKREGQEWNISSPSMVTVR